MSKLSQHHDEPEELQEPQSKWGLVLAVYRGLGESQRFVIVFLVVVAVLFAGWKGVDLTKESHAETSFAQQSSVDSLKQDLNAVKEDVKFVQTTMNMQGRGLEQALMKVQVKLAKMDGDIDEDDADALNDQISGGLIRAAELQTKILEFKRRRP